MISFVYFDSPVRSDYSRVKHFIHLQVTTLVDKILHNETLLIDKDGAYICLLKAEIVAMLLNSKV